MLINFNEYEFYLVCGKTDMRCGAFSLARKVQDELRMDPLEKKIFIFCGSNNKCIKMLLWDNNGFLLLQKLCQFRYNFCYVDQLNYSAFVYKALYEKEI